MRELREAAGVPLSRAAAQSGWDKGHLSRVERGHTKPSRELIEWYDASFGAGQALVNQLMELDAAVRAGRDMTLRDMRRQGAAGTPGWLRSPHRAALPDAVPGEIVTVSMRLQAPSQVGASTAYFKITDDAGRLYYPGPESPLALALAAALVVPQVAISSASAAPAARGPVDPPVPSIPQKYLDQPITWSVCSFDAAVKNLYPQAPTTNCAKVKVPMDWAHPDAHPDVEVAVAYSKATGTSKGLVTTNPGGPGGAGLTLSASLAVEKTQLFSDFDLLGFDPRGFGQSTPLQCLTTTEKLAALPTTPDLKERTRQTHLTEVAEAKLFADACSATEFGQFVSSQQTVYDMEFLRALFKARQLNLIGYSYGTWLGGWYADTYPSKVGRFVIDSNMDWTHTQWENVNFDPFSGQRRRDTQLFPWIARHADQIDGLGSTFRQVRSTYNGIRAGLVTLVKAGTSSVRGDDLDTTIYSVQYGNVRFIRGTLDILIHDEYVKDPSASGEIELRHVDRAWARISPELQAFDTLAAMRARYGVTPAAASTHGRPEGGLDPLDHRRRPRDRGQVDRRRSGQPRCHRYDGPLQRHEVEQRPAVLPARGRPDGRQVRLLRLHERRTVLCLLAVRAAGPQARSEGFAAHPDDPG